MLPGHLPGHLEGQFRDICPVGIAEWGDRRDTTLGVSRMSRLMPGHFEFQGAKHGNDIEGWV